MHGGLDEECVKINVCLIFANGCNERARVVARKNRTDHNGGWGGGGYFRIPDGRSAMELESAYNSRSVGTANKSAGSAVSYERPTMRENAVRRDFQYKKEPKVPEISAHNPFE